MVAVLAALVVAVPLASRYDSELFPSGTALVAPVAATAVWELSLPQVQAAPDHETEAAVAFPTVEAAAPSPMPLLLVLAENLAEVLAPTGERPYAMLEAP